MGEPDELFSLKNHLWVGNYDTALREGKALSYLDPPYSTERDFYIYRCQIVLGQTQAVLQELDRIERSEGTLNISFAAIRLLALYKLDKATNLEMILLTLTTYLGDPSASTNPHMLLIAGMIYGQEAKYSDAFSVLLRPESSLEHIATAIMFYLQMNRPDVAQQQLTQMKQIEEDATLTQLAMGWVYLYSGEEKYDEAALLFQELTDRFGASSLLLNARAVAFLHLRNFQEAERLLQQAKQVDKSANEDIILNLIVVSRHLGYKDEVIQPLIAQLHQVNPMHPWIVKYQQLHNGFDELISKFAA